MTAAGGEFVNGRENKPTINLTCYATDETNIPKCDMAPFGAVDRRLRCAGRAQSSGCGRFREPERAVRGTFQGVRLGAALRLVNTLILTGELWTYLADLNKQAQERLDTIMEQMKAIEGVTEELKRTHQME